MGYVPENLRGDREIVMKAVKQNGSELCYASRKLKADREIVKIAVEQNSRAFKEASEALKGDREIAMIAVKQHDEAFRHTSEELKRDKAFVLEAMANCEVTALNIYNLTSNKMQRKIRHIYRKETGKDFSTPFTTEANNDVREAIKQWLERPKTSIIQTIVNCISCGKNSKDRD